MLEAVAISPHHNTSIISSDNNADIEEKKSKNEDAYQYQIDSCSYNSTIDADDDSESYEDSIVISPTNNGTSSSLPIFESVSVVNSNDVHFGNKTIFQGPVTIRQFVYPEGKNNTITNDCDSTAEAIIVKNSNVINGSVAEGLNNFGFVKDDDKNENDNTNNNNDSKNDVAIIETPLQDASQHSKVLQCFRNKKLSFKETLIFFCIILISFAVVSIIFLWKYQAPTAIILQDKQNHVVDEEDGQTPIEYKSDSNATLGPKVRIVTRLQWLAQPPIDKLDPLKLPVSIIIIQHTATEACHSQAECVFQTRTIQTFHIESKSWFDIAYNFLVGGDGDAYEGRGWKMQGAHTFGFNNISIGIAFIGTFINTLPPTKQIYAFHKLVAKGVELGYVTKNYKILAARQIYGTESPGRMFYEEIKKWDHWSDKV